MNRFGPIPNLVLDALGSNLLDGAVVGSPDCVGSVQSASYDLGGGLFLYAYELECHCGPNWDVGYSAVSGGLKVPLNGCLPRLEDVRGDGTANDSSFQTDEPGDRKKPYFRDLRPFNFKNENEVDPLDGDDGTDLGHSGVM